MSDIEILHLSDLHWNENAKADRQIVIDALIKDLREQVTSDKIRPDMVVFSGDLVQSGEAPQDFESAYDHLLQPVLDAVDLTSDALFIAPGNHDIARQLVRDAAFVEEGLRGSITSVEKANKFLDDLNSGNRNHIQAIERVDNFYSFVDKYTPSMPPVSPLVRCHQRNVRGSDVGIACFDTTWRATGEPNDVDRNRLIIGERNVDTAVAQLSGSDLRIAIMHHPTEWLADFDEAAVSGRLSANFDVIFCGHTHRTLPQTRTTPQGSAILSQTGSIYSSRKWFNGYQIVSLDAAKGECTFIVRTYYDTPRREFDKAVNAMASGEVTFPYAPTNHGNGSQIVESFLREMRPEIRKTATDHINMVGQQSPQTDIREIFVAPPLSTRSGSDDEDETSDQSATAKLEDISINSILNSDKNYVVTGSREAGKSSLLHYMATLVAEGNCDRPRIPVVLSCSSLKGGKYNLKRAINYYYGSIPKGLDVDKAIDEGLFLFFVDDLDANSHLVLFKEHVQAYHKNRWISIETPASGSLVATSDLSKSLESFVEVKIGMLPRRSIRALAKQWSPIIGQSDDKIFETVMAQIRRDGLPRTGYMVTLLLWAIKQEAEFERVNEAVLLSNVIDHLLGRADFRLATHGQFDPRAKEIVLEHLASFLRETGGVADVDAVTSFLVDLFQSKRLTFKAMDVLAELIKCGILSRKDNDVYFKYACFGEYFFASRMRSDSDIFSKVLSDGNYVNYSREVELLSGLRRENTEILRSIMEDIATREPADITDLKPSDFDQLTEINAGIQVTQKRLNELKKKRLTSEQIDDLMDVAERRAIKKQENAMIEDQKKSEVDLFGENVESSSSGANADRMTPATFISASDILARVIRNSDFTDFEVKAPATRTVISNAVKVCLLVRKEMLQLLEEVLAKDDKPPFNEEEKNALISFVNKLLVLSLANMLSEQLSSPNVVPMAKEIFKANDISSAEKLFLCFLLQTSRSSDWSDSFSELLRERRESGFIFDCITTNLRWIVNSQYLNERENEQLHAVVDTMENLLGWSAAETNQVKSDFRKAQLQADFRDTRA